MKIGDREIKNGGRPFCVAEISGNHLGKFNNAIELIVLAKRSGADAVKFQAYTPDTITLDCKKPDFIIQDGLWKGRTLHELYGKAHTPFEWFPDLFAKAKEVEIPVFASVFDPSSVDMLERLECPAYKIASFEIVDLPLIEYAVRTGKPVIISTGLATPKEVAEADAASNFTAAFLHCTSDYPGTVEDADLGRMQRIKEWIDRDGIVGLSDHTASSEMLPVMATALGAAIIEKHFKLPGDTKSEDAAFSLGPKEFQRMTAAVGTAYQAMKLRAPFTRPTYQLRRSLYAVDDIRRGEEFTSNNIRSIRPGYGLPPKFLGKLIGKKADRDYRKGDRLV